MKIKHQLFLTHGILVLLAIIIVFANVATYKGMENDALIINQSGKLRALSYNMAQLTYRVNSADSYGSKITIHQDLDAKINEFDSILQMLCDKQTNPKDGIGHKDTIDRLEKIKKEWIEIFKPFYLDVSAGNFTENPGMQINKDIDQFVIDINDMVTSYSIYSRGKVFTALTINRSLVLVIILFTIFSFALTYRRIQRPLGFLMRDLKGLSFTDKEISEKIKNINIDEISEMTRYFNEMIYDHLTKVYNRRSGLAKLNRIIHEEKRKDEVMSLCFIDINGLKEVNDYLGHKYGDELIVTTVECIKQEISKEDFIIRMGGDEFLIVLNDSSEEKAEMTWQRIDHSYQVINKEEKRPYLISVSHGIVEYDRKGELTIDLLITQADDKMYAEKRLIKEEMKAGVIRS